MATILDDLSPCRCCGEQAMMVTFDNRCFVRPYRFSKGKRYQKRHKAEDTCKTEIVSIADVALARAQWIEQFGAPDAAGEDKQ